MKMLEINGGLAPEKIDAMEKEFNLHLPADYRQFLLEVGGGVADEDEYNEIRVADLNDAISVAAVSYTHLDVYKRQALYLPPCSGFAVLQRFCKTFGFLCRRPLGRSFFAAFDPKSKRNSSILTQ